MTALRTASTTNALAFALRLFLMFFVSSTYNASA